MLDDQLRSYVDAIERTVLLHGELGFTPAELGARNKPFRALSENDKFRACVLLCKRHKVAVMIGERGGFRFFPRHSAPDGAYNAPERQQTAGEVIMQALQMTAA